MKIKLAIVFGGKSPEHEISVISALQTAHAADTNKYEIVPIYITKKGVWYTGAPLLNLENYKNTDALLAQSEKIWITANSDENAIYKYPQKSFFGKETFLNNIDVVLPVLHGSHGEDGAIQGLFELMNIPYAGCNVLASAIGMDKIAMKIMYQSLGLPMVDFIHFFSSDWIQDANKVLEKSNAQLGFPVIVKPADLGSSIGISKANNMDELRESIDNAVQFSRKVLIEKAIVNLKEVNCSVLGDYEKAQPSVCEEPVVQSDKILSYNEKYVNQGGQKGSEGMATLKRRIPADIPTEMTTQIQQMALRGFQGTDCSGVARIDFLIDMDNNNVYVNEINTIPGSLSFYLWEKSGVDFTALVDNLVRLAQKKHREKNNLKFSFEANIFNLKGAKLGGKK
jgi:D-alanine-D-alanine ligase